MLQTLSRRPDLSGLSTQVNHYCLKPATESWSVLYLEHAGCQEGGLAKGQFLQVPQTHHPALHPEVKR